MKTAKKQIRTWRDDSPFGGKSSWNDTKSPQNLEACARAVVAGRKLGLELTYRNYVGHNLAVNPPSEDDQRQVLAEMAAVGKEKLVAELRVIKGIVHPPPVRCACGGCPGGCTPGEDGWTCSRCGCA